MDKGTDRLDSARLDEAMTRADIKNDAELARRIPCAQSQIRRWRDGRTTPTGDNLERLCAVLDVEAGFLFGREQRRELPPIAMAAPTEVNRLLHKLRWAVRSFVQGYITLPELMAIADADDIREALHETGHEVNDDLD